MTEKRKWYSVASLLIALASLLFAVWIFPKLPDTIPMHWNIRGEVDHYYPKESAFIFSSLPLIIWFGMTFLPKLDPRRASYRLHADTYAFIRLILVVFLTVFNMVALLYGLGIKFDMIEIAKVMVGLLFLFMGNVLGKIRPNFFVGIRTPWTLSSDRVWRKTHKLGGWAFIVAGCSFLAFAWESGPISFWVPFAILIASMFGTVFYSYVLYKEECKNQ
jgi:uncharacterized membrane protein